MNKLVLAAYQIRAQRKAGEHQLLVIVSDNLDDYSEQACRRLFAPWSHWLHVERFVPISEAPLDKTLLRDAGAGPGRLVVAPLRDPKREAEVLRLADKCGATPVYCAFPKAGTLDSDLVREVSFFDFEFGGKNEWNGDPTVYPANCLRQLSSVHCFDFYPKWAFADLPPELARRRPLKVMDIGCGPVSILRWGAVQGDISITGVDPLLDMYAVMLSRHGYDALPKIRCDVEISDFAENIDSQVPDGHFDFIYTQNALDHTQQPVKVVELMGKKLAPHGLVVVQVAEREGTRQKWDQLHQTDIFFQNGELTYCHRDQVAKPLLSPASGLALAKSYPAKPEWLAFSLKKK